MLLRTPAFAVVALSLASFAACAQSGSQPGNLSGSFDLLVAGKTVGKDTFKLEKKNGYKLSSRYSYHLGGTEADTSDDFKFSDALAYQDGGSSSIASQMHSSFTPNKARTEITIGMVQGGVQDARSLAIKPDFIVMPHYDAGAAQVMLLLAVTHPTEKNLYNIVVPAGASSAPRAGEGSQDPNDVQSRAQVGGNNAYDALWTKGADTTGTLEGKPVTLHTYTLTAGKYVWTFIADDSNNLMQLNDSMVRASYIRAKFKLDAPK